MRTDTALFVAADQNESRRPQFIVGIIFPSESIYITSHTGISGVPGVVLDGLLESFSSISQRLKPHLGRSEIGRFSFRVTDKAGALTAQLRDRLLSDDYGIKGREVRFLVGAEGFAFADFQRFQTQIAQSSRHKDGAYAIQCEDIGREQRKDIFEPKRTTLRDSVTESSTTIPVYDTSQFLTVQHGTGWSDAASATVGYLKLEDEIIRWTGKTSDSFTGCTRGALNTRAARHEVEASAQPDRRQEVNEFIYLDLPAVKLLLAVMTGDLYNQGGATLPAHWHLGIASSWIRTADHTGIGADLWSPTVETEGVPLRFEGLKKVDGRKFIEDEILSFLGCFQPVYSDGTLGLRRAASLVDDAAAVVTLDESNVVEYGDLDYDVPSMVNRHRVDWSWKWQEETYKRFTELVDGPSITTHGRTTLEVIPWKGAHGAKHTDAMIRQRLNARRDMVAEPPLNFALRLLPSMNRIEPGDVARVKLSQLRDFAKAGGALAPIDRSFIITQVAMDHLRAQLRVECMGSTARPAVTPINAGTPLADAAYSAVGAALSTVATIAGNVVQPGTYAVNGNADMNAAGARYYHLGDLTVDQLATLNLGANVQIWIRGFLTINGVISGVGGGLSGVAGSGVNATPGNPGYIGNSRGMDGVIAAGNRLLLLQTNPCVMTRGQNDAFPSIVLTVDGNVIRGIQGDMRGTGGGSGGASRQLNTLVNTGGTGGAGGAGLVIVCRGLGFGASGSINLSGSPGGNGTQGNTPQFSLAVWSGAGGAGGPGALLILLDGSGISLPDITNKYVARTGVVAINGRPIAKRQVNRSAPDAYLPGFTGATAGYLDPDMISDHPMPNSTHRIMYVPGNETVQADQDAPPPAPTNIATEAKQDLIVVTVTPPAALPPGAVTRLFASITNDRTAAVQVAEGRQDVFPVASTPGVQRWFWATIYDPATNKQSAFFPSTLTSTFTATALGGAAAAWSPILSADMTRDGQTFTKATGSGTWNAAFRSQEGYEGCFVTWRPSQTNRALMVALNTDPAADDSYTSLDFAIYNANDGAVQIYENGSQVSTHGSYAANDQFTITYDRVRLNYYRNATLLRSVVRVGLRLFADSSFFDVGGAVNGVAFGSMGPAGATGGNLLRVDAWTAGALTAAVGNFTLNESTSGENAIVNGTGPHGATQLLWECQCVDPGTGSGGQANGGWGNTGDLNQLIDPTKSYRSTVWVRVRGALSGNTFYHGCGRANDTSDLGGGANSNPYFTARAHNTGEFVLDQYYLSVGIIHGSGYAGGQSGLSGLWDPLTGRRVYAGSDFRMTAGARTQEHRAYQFYGGNTTARQDLTEPRFEVMDGTEPTLASLLVPPDADNTLKKRLIPDEEFSLPSPSLYWRTSIGGGASAITFSETGGLVGGRVTMTWGQGGTTRLIALRNPPYQPVSEVTVIVTIRLRRTASLANAMTLQVDLVRDDDPSFGSVIAGDQEDLELSNTTLPNVNQWYEFVRTCYFFGEVAGTPYGAVSLLAIGGASVDGQSIEIDHLSANLGPPLFAEGLDGAVNAPSSVAQNKYLRDDNTWQGIAAPHVQGAGNDSITASFNLDGAFAEEFARCTNGSAITITLVNDSNSPMAQWATCIVMRAGSGAINFAAGSGVTIDGLTSVPSVGTSVAVTRTGANRYFVA